MEIERKFTVKELPEDLESYSHKEFVQGYLSVEPVVRVRREGDRYFLTYKGKGLMVRDEYNLPLTEASFRHLIEKADGRIIRKTRYFLPLLDDNNISPDPALSLEEFHEKGRLIELDVFEGELSELIMAEVEFPSAEDAENFVPPDWFGEDVTCDPAYHNSYISQYGFKKPQ